MSYDFSINSSINCGVAKAYIESLKFIGGTFPNYHLIDENRFMNISLENLDEEGTSIGNVKEDGSADVINIHIPYAYWNSEELSRDEVINVQLEYIDLVKELADEVFKSAYDEQKESVVDDTYFAYVLREYGDGFYSDGYHEKAKAYYTRALKYRGVGETYYKRGLCYYVKKDYESALADFTEAVNEGWNSTQYLTAQAAVLSYLNRNEEAVEVFTKIINLSPSGEAYENRAITYKYLGQYEKMVADYTKAIELADNKLDKSGYYVMRSGGYKFLSDYENMFKDLKKAVEIEPRNISAYLDTIEAYITLDRMDDGLKYIESYEHIILEIEEQRTMLLYLYMKGLIYIAKDKSINDFEETIDVLAEMGYKLSWYFGHIKKWIDTSDYDRTIKERLLELTERVENSDKLNL